MLIDMNAYPCLGWTKNQRADKEADGMVTKFNKTTTTAVVSGGAIMATAFFADLAYIMDYLRSFPGQSAAEIGQMVLGNPLMMTSGAALAAAGLGAAAGHRRARIRADQEIARIKAEAETRQAQAAEQADARLARVHTHLHNFEDQLRSYLALQTDQAANKAIDACRLCQMFAVEMRRLMDVLDDYFTELEGHPCRVALYTFDEDGTLLPRVHYSHASERERRNLIKHGPRLSPAMQQIVEMDPDSTPIVKIEDIRGTATDWKDPSIVNSSLGYNSVINVGVQCRPDQGINLGRFRRVKPRGRILAGFLVVESQGNALNTPNIEDAVAHYADRLFSVLCQVSEASYHLVVESSWNCHPDRPPRYSLPLRYSITTGRTGSGCGRDLSENRFRVRIPAQVCLRSEFDFCSIFVPGN